MTTLVNLWITTILTLIPLQTVVDNSSLSVEIRVYNYLVNNRSLSEATCALQIAYAESRYQLHVRNKTSGAYGVFQLMQVERNLTLREQLHRATKYVEHRYGVPDKRHAWCNALSARHTKGWY